MEGKLITAYNLWLTHYTLWKLNLLDGYSNVLENSVNTGRSALKKSILLSDDEKYLDLVYTCKNNLLFTLIHARWPSDDDRKDAIDNLSIDVYRFAEKQEREVMPIMPPAHLSRLKANRGLALIRFADDKKEKDDKKREEKRKANKEKGEAIIKEILKSNTLEEDLHREIEKNKGDIEEILEYIKNNEEVPLKGHHDVIGDINKKILKKQ